MSTDERPPFTLELSTTDRLGRFTAQNVTSSFTIDNAKLLDEPAEHAGTAEYFLASLAGCALNLIAARTVEWELPAPDFEMTASYLVDQDDSTRFARIDLAFRFRNLVDDRQRLVDDFIARCPIYNTLVRGGAPITVAVE